MIKPESSIFPYLKTKAHALLSYSPTEQQIKALATTRTLDELRSKSEREGANLESIFLKLTEQEDEVAEGISVLREALAD